jgi:putative acetyltransferase
MTTSRGLSELSTHASLLAQPAFSALGFDVIQKESVSINDEKLERFEMKKSI